MWSEIRVPHVAERFIGFSLPNGDEFLAISYEGIHRVTLSSPVTITHYKDYPEGGDLYDWRNQVLRFDNREYPIVGLYGGTPLLTSTTGEIIIILPDTQRAQVIGPDGELALDHYYEDLSGDWAVATFSFGYDLVMVGLPYDIYVFRRS